MGFLQFALRWRSEEEVLSGAGEETCGNTRCTHHELSRSLPLPPLQTIELPFAYEEHGEQKFALVKVVLCERCLKKLMWKREKEKEVAQRSANADGMPSQSDEMNKLEPTEEMLSKDRKQRRHYRDERDGDDTRTREPKSKRHSRSQSPSRRHHSESKRARRRSHERSSRKHDSGE